MALEAKSSNLFIHPIQGYRQAVRHETLTFVFAGSNPATPATFSGVSPSGKATDSDSVIRRFESYYPSHSKERICTAGAIFIMSYWILSNSDCFAFDTGDTLLYNK